MTQIQSNDAVRLKILLEEMYKEIQDITAQMDRIAKNPNIIVTQERWDQLFSSWDSANKRRVEIGEALLKSNL